MLALRLISSYSATAYLLVMAHTNEIANREQRRAAIQRLLEVLDQAASAMDALIADGYPSPVASTLTPKLVAELQQQMVDLQVLIDL
jgi:hypothetical protein